MNTPTSDISAHEWAREDVIFQAVIFKGRKKYIATLRKNKDQEKDGNHSTVKRKGFFEQYIQGGERRFSRPKGQTA